LADARCSLEADKGIRIGLADLQDDDPDVYAMISKADTLGTFRSKAARR
jgi:error-prone DNA polymerase